MPIELMIRVTDVKTGVVELERPSHSWTLQGMQIITAQFMQGHVATIKDTSNTARTWTVAVSGPFLRSDGAAGDATKGVVVGTGTGAEATSNYALGTLIAHGSAAAQLNYGSMTYTQAIDSSGTVNTGQSRTFSNSSGSTITVEEVGLYMNSGWVFCVIRDVLGGDAFDIENGDSKFVEYILQTVN